MMRYVLLFIIAVTLSFSVTPIAESAGFQQIPVIGMIAVWFAYVTSGAMVGALK